MQPQLPPPEEFVSRVEIVTSEIPKEVVEIPTLNHKVEQTLHKYGNSSMI
jgi:hypothetical protein